MEHAPAACTRFLLLFFLICWLVAKKSTTQNSVRFWRMQWSGHGSEPHYLHNLNRRLELTGANLLKTMKWNQQFRFLESHLVWEVFYLAKFNTYTTLHAIIESKNFEIIPLRVMSYELWLWQSASFGAKIEFNCIDHTSYNTNRDSNEILSSNVSARRFSLPNCFCCPCHIHLPKAKRATSINSPKFLAQKNP